jgi:phage-related protein
VFELEFYALPNGKIPVRDFLDSLSPKMRAKALASLELLEEFGPLLREPYSKSLGDGLLELRIKFSSDISRIFYFFVVGEHIVLTNGFIKKTRKTPKSELELARKYKAEYERRHCHE